MDNFTIKQGSNKPLAFSFGGSFDHSSIKDIVVSMYDKTGKRECVWNYPENSDKLVWVHKDQVGSVTVNGDALSPSSDYSEASTVLYVMTTQEMTKDLVPGSTTILIKFVDKNGLIIFDEAISGEVVKRLDNDIMLNGTLFSQTEEDIIELSIENSVLVYTDVEQLFNTRLTLAEGAVSDLKDMVVTGKIAKVIERISEYETIRGETLEWRLQCAISGGTRVSGNEYRICSETLIPVTAGSRFVIPSGTRGSVFIYNRNTFNKSYLIESRGLDDGLDYTCTSDGFAGFAMGYGTSNTVKITEGNYLALAERLTCYIKYESELRTIEAEKPDSMIRYDRSVDDYIQGDNVTDTEFLQYVINDSAGNTLYLPDSTYVLDKPLIIPSGTRIIGNGSNSVIKFNNHANTYTELPFRTYLGAKASTKRAYICFDEDAEGCELSNFVVCGVEGDIVDEGQFGVCIRGKHHKITNLQIHDINYKPEAYLGGTSDDAICGYGTVASPGWGLAIYFAEDVSVDGCYISNCGYECLGVEDSSNIRITGCVCGDANRVPGQVHRNSKYVYISDCRFEKSAYGKEKRKANGKENNAGFTLHGTLKHVLQHIYISNTYIGGQCNGVQGGEQYVHFDKCHFASTLFNMSSSGMHHDDYWSVTNCLCTLINYHGDHGLFVGNRVTKADTMSTIKTSINMEGTDNFAAANCTKADPVYEDRIEYTGERKDEDTAPTTNNTGE